MLTRWAGPVLALAISTLTASAQTDLQAMHDATLQAFQAGNHDLALDRARAAMTTAQDLKAPDPEAYAFALNNVAFLLTASNQNPAEAKALWTRALAYLAARDLRGSQAGLTVAMQLAALEARQRKTAVATARIAQALRDARGTQFQAPVAGAAATQLLELGAYQDAVVAFSEMALLDPDLIRGSYGDLYVQLSGLIEQAESDGRASDLATLIEAKIIIARAFVPQKDRDSAIRNLRFQRYFALHQAGKHDRARQALTAWLTSGPLSNDELEFVNGIASTARAFANGAEIQTLDDLETARTAITMLRGIDTPKDAELGRALMAIGHAEARFGQYERAIQYLSDSVTILARSDAGQPGLPQAQAELAWYLHLVGRSDQAAALFAQSDAAPDALPVRPLDAIASALDRAQFHIDLDDPDTARIWMAKARTMLLSEPVSDRQSALMIRHLNLRVLWAADPSDPDIAVDQLMSALNDQRRLGGGTDTDFAVTLVNTANSLAMSGAFNEARALVDEAVAINAKTLPATAPQALAAFAMLQQLNLLLGDQDATIENLRTLTAARQAPAHRDRLPDASWDFELFAWALLADPDTRSPARIAEAFEALQWTQITRSAEALGVLETRLAIDDPGRGALLRQRQDLIAAYEDLEARLAFVRTAGAETAAGSLTAQLTEIDNRLSDVNSTLDALGLDTSGVGQVDPLALSDAQVLLNSDEALVTFLLPSLNPDVIPGANGSSNYVLTITQDAVHVAQIAEISRSKLNARINKFRCDVAISDPQCENGHANGLRGAMLEGEGDVSPGGFFDLDAGYDLYSDLFQGVDTVLAEHPHLIIVPPSDMLRLPFEALVTTDTRAESLAEVDWLVRRNSVSVLPSISSLRALRNRDAPKSALSSMLGFGDPVIGQTGSIDCNDLELAALRGIPPLQTPLSDRITSDGLPLADVEFLSALPRLADSRCELHAIRTAFDDSSRVVLGAMATETEVKTLDASGALAAYDVLVFATHGLTAGETGAASPGLVLTPPATATKTDDGLLSASEIATLDLNAGLVVLSACNTAAGDGQDADGLSGLARAFFQAGAHSLLVTHWSVYSEAAVDISTGLFDALARHPGQRHADALQASVLAVLDDPTRPAFHHHPSYWAAFAMVGAD